MEGNYYHCSELQPIGRRAEEVQLEQQLMAMFPGMLKDVRLVRQEQAMGGDGSGERQCSGSR